MESETGWLDLGDVITAGGRAWWRDWEVEERERAEGRDRWEVIWWRIYRGIVSRFGTAWWLLGVGSLSCSSGEAGLVAGEEDIAAVDLF